MPNEPLLPANRLILGDNLEIMKTLESESVDLIYLAPPFFSNRNYEIIWGDEGEIRSFKDRWAGGIDHYIAWLKERVELMYRLLKKTGSLFLHCDWHDGGGCRQAESKVDRHRPVRPGGESHGVAFGQTARLIQCAVLRSFAQIRFRHLAIQKCLRV